MRKKLLAGLLSVVMILSLLPITALADNNVAKNTRTGTEYATLALAISNATDGDTIQLLKNTSEAVIKGGISYYVAWPKMDFTLDLNGNKIEGNYSYGAFVVQDIKMNITDSKKSNTSKIINNYASSYGAIMQYGNSSVNLEYVTIQSTGDGVAMYNNSNSLTIGKGALVKSTSSSDAAVRAGDSTDADTANIVTVDGGTVEGYVYGIFAQSYGKIVINSGDVKANGTPLLNNGSNPGESTMIINGGTVDCVDRDNNAIYHPGKGTLIVNGGTIIGGTGIEMRAGSLIIPALVDGKPNSAIVTAEQQFYEEPNDNGKTLKGVAVGASQHTTNHPITIDIAGGTFTSTGTGGKAVYATDLQYTSAGEDVKINITGGKFAAAGNAVEFYTSITNIKPSIAAGLFTQEPNPTYLAADCKAANINDSAYHYIVGLDAGSNNAGLNERQLIKGKYNINPIMYVADGYKVIASDNKDYPYEVVPKEKDDPDQGRTIIENLPETVIDEKITDEEEIQVAKGIIEDMKVSGVADALEENRDKFISDVAKDEEKQGELNPTVVSDAKQVDVEITVEAIVTACATKTSLDKTEKEIDFELTPYATVKAITSEGVVLSSEVVKIDNDYLSKTTNKAINVKVGSKFEPAQIVHIRGDGINEAFTKGNEASFAKKTFKCEGNDNDGYIVTVQILQFSELKLLAEKRFVEVKFDANGGSGEMESTYIEEGGNYKLPECGFTAPANKKFKAWKIESTEYAPGNEITISKATEVKAIWVEGAPNTGDHNNAMLFVGLGGVALLVIIALAVIMLKKKTYR